MTAKQKANQARLKKVVAEAKKLRAKNPKLTQAQAVKQAWAITYSKKTVSGVKKKAVKKSAPTKVKAKKSKRTSEMHTDTNSHNVNIRVVSGLSKIIGVPHKAKYYISTKKQGVKHIEYFDKLPKDYYKGMSQILYLMRLEDSGTVLTPIRHVKNDLPVKKS